MDQITVLKSADTSERPASLPRPQQLPTIKRYFFFTLLCKICSIAWTLVDTIVIATIYVDDDYDDHYAIRWERMKKILIPKYSVIIIFELISSISGWTTYVTDSKRYIIIYMLSSMILVIIEIGSLFILPGIRGYIKIIDILFILVAIKFYQSLQKDAKFKHDAIEQPDANVNRSERDAQFNETHF